ncbi:MAG TPA: IS110 family transposase [Steroidobacteraceae bacterium]|nr:IS110 family transposase [Steroidobacteraceae bacterium]
MDNDITAFVGMDVHKGSIAVAVAEAGRTAPRFVGTTGPQLAELLKALSHLGEPQRMLIAYEAGPCGYGLARQLGARGYRCEVIAVAKTPRKPGERVKTDRRDALMLARYLRAAELTPVVIPDERDEAIRDLSRAREDAVRARLKARQQLKAMLLRHGHRYTGKTSWTAAHERFLAKVSFDHPAQDVAYAEYRSAVREAHDRAERITAALHEQVATWRWQGVVRALMALRGVEFVAAVTLLAELGDLARFAHPKQLMSYLGLVPSEYSTGESRVQGKITKTGNGHARRILIESAWTYRLPARMSRELVVRNEGLPKTVRDIAWHAQLRLCSRFRRLQARGVHQTKTCTAIARELAGFIWDIARQVPAAT